MPWDRFERVVAERDQARAELAQAQEGRAQAETRGKTVDQLTAQLAEEKGKREQAEGRFASYTTIAARGILDPDVVAAIEAAHGGLPAQDRPKLGDWLDGFRADGKDAKADAEKMARAPTLLRPHLDAAWRAAGGGGGTGGTGASGARGAHGGGGSGIQPPAGGPPSVQRVQELGAKRMRGEITPEQYKTEMDALRRAGR